MRTLASLLKISFWFVLILLVASHFMRDRFPDQRSILGEMSQEPKQEEVTMDPIIVTKDATEYTINPQYSYDLYGVVVSEHTTDSLFDYYHKRWGDTLNVKDLCVVWGENAMTGVYSDMKYKSGSWTCYFRTDDSDTWRAFSQDQISNNHLLTSSPQVQQVLKNIRRGDQIHIQGYLADYSHDGGFERGTSISRTDRGNNACETVYISEVTVLKEANGFWRDVFIFSFYLIFIIPALRLLLAALAPRGTHRLR